MKYFTEPTGKFVIKIPSEWQYKNIAMGFGETSPFSFQCYEEPSGAFQISCYTIKEKPPNTQVKVQDMDTDKLEFLSSRMDGGGFNMHLWYAVVADHVFMAKYIYETSKADDPAVAAELTKVAGALSTLTLIGTGDRELALELDKYEKFIASLAASFDLKAKAINNESLIELLVIIASQIDAYLRIAIVMTKQFQEKTNRIDIGLLYQGETDAPVMERKIYKQARHMGIITQQTLNELEVLYNKRNKVIHRYIISAFKTVNLYQIVYDYENVCETVRQALKVVEQRQYREGLGIHGNGRDPETDPTEESVNMMRSQINDKHLILGLYRNVDPEKSL